MANAPIPQDSRNIAYTSGRPDVFALVPASSRRILDVGCSNGALGSSLLADAPGRSVYGIEGDPAFVAEAAKCLTGAVQADLNQFDWNGVFGSQRFDCIIFADVLEHLVEPRKCLASAAALLAPDGCVVVSLPNIRHLSVFRAIFLNGHFPRRARGIFDQTHLRWFTLADANALLASCGLQVSAGSQALRWGDAGGGRANRLLNRLPSSFKRWAPVREFLTYQFCLRAAPKP